MCFSLARLVNLYNTIHASIPKECCYHIHMIDGFYPKPKCRNTATVESWILDTNRKQKGVIVWFRECRNNTKYSLEYKLKVERKIAALDNLLQLLHASLSK